jgi:hypothetical protein
MLLPCQMPVRRSQAWRGLRKRPCALTAEPAPPISLKESFRVLAPLALRCWLFKVPHNRSALRVALNVANDAIMVFRESNSRTKEQPDLSAPHLQCCMCANACKVFCSNRAE